MIPGPGCSGSITTAAPTFRSAIERAASCRVQPGATVTTELVIPVRTSIRANVTDRSRVIRSLGSPVLPYVRTSTLQRRRDLYRDALEVIRLRHADPDLS